MPNFNQHEFKQQEDLGKCQPEYLTRCISDDLFCVPFDKSDPQPQHILHTNIDRGHQSQG